MICTEVDMLLKYCSIHYKTLTPQLKVRRTLKPMLERASKVAKEFGGEDQQVRTLE